ncbi:MAG: LmeA family phospholipid-binding protein [Canibacter sp.]
MRKKRTITVMSIVIIALAVLVGVGELLVRSAVPSIAADEIRDKLSLEVDHEVDVQPHGFVLWQVVTGRLTNIDVAIPDAPIIEGLSASVQLHAGSVALDPASGPINGGTVHAQLSPEQFQTFVTTVSNGQIDSATSSDGRVQVARAFEVFGTEIPLTAEVKVGSEDGALVLEPVKFSAAGIQATPDDVASVLGGILGPYANELSEPQTLCVKDRMPAGIELTNLRPHENGNVTVDFTLAPDILTDPSQQELGTCD